MYVILVYDISIDSNGQKRWRRVFKKCKRYLHHIQNSVFEGELSESQLYILLDELKSEINDETDSIIVFKSRSDKWLDKEILGREQDDKFFI